MRIKIEKFANINNVDIEFSNQMNILIGDNGTGKTLLLEAYSKINDTVISHLDSKNNFISSIIDQANLNINKISKEGNNRYKYKLSFTDILEVENLFNVGIRKLKDEIEERLKSEVLNENLSMDGLLIDFKGIDELINFSGEISVSIKSFSNNSDNNFINFCYCLPFRYDFNFN